MTEAINVQDLLAECRKKGSNTSNIYTNLTMINYIRLEETLSWSDKIVTYGNSSTWLVSAKQFRTLEYSVGKWLNILDKTNNSLKDNDWIIIAKAVLRLILRLEPYPYLGWLYEDKVSDFISKLNYDLTGPIKNLWKVKHSQFFDLIDWNKQKQLFYNNTKWIEQLKTISVIPKEQSAVIVKEPVYVVNKQWYDNFRGFLSEVELNIVNEDALNMIFDKDTVLRNWFNNHSQSTRIYCGEINNFAIRKYKDYWLNEIGEQGEGGNYNSIYLKKNMVVDQDIVLLSKTNYDLLKETFGSSLYEIQRESNEVFYINLDVWLLCKQFIIPTKAFNWRKKQIQLSRATTFSEFKEIIHKYFVGCLIIEGEVGNIKPDFTILFTDKLKKMELFTIIISYQYDQNTIQTYLSKSNITRVEWEEDFKWMWTQPNITVLIEYNCNGVDTNQSQCTFFNQLPYNPVQCHYCNGIVNTGVTGVACKRSPFCKFVYCNSHCRVSDTSHAQFHDMLNKWLIVPFDLNILFEKSIKDYLVPGSKHGLTGLQNLGNTCFMSSALQCWSHCELWTTYFLSKLYLTEINTNVKYGSGGEIARAYYDWLYQLWVENHSYIHPMNFRNIFTSFAKQFAGYNQQDSHEVLTFMLDGLHEDLNRHKEKKYVELIEQKVGESDKDASVRWWNCNLSRDNSIIVDLFYGQYKNTITCPVCKRISITYDPFMCIGLPIPNIRYKGTVYIINENNNSIRKEKLNFGENEFFSNIWSRINNDETKKLHGIFCEDNKTYLKSLKNEDFISNWLKTRVNANIIIYEFDWDDTRDKVPFFITPVAKDPTVEGKWNNLFYPKVFYMDMKDTVTTWRGKITKYYKRYFDIPGQEYELCIFNNITHVSNMNCEFCNEKCNHCWFNFKDDDTIEYVKGSQVKSRNFLLWIKFKVVPNIELYDTFTDSGKFTSEITWTDCFDSLSKSETWDKENTWHCSQCKEHREAEKKLEIFKLPKIWIIQLKRFKSTFGYFQNSKIDKYVEFPVDELSLDKYMIDSTAADKEYKYELFGVNQHYGWSIGGHYISLCKNNGTWYEFDDDKVSWVNDHDKIVSSEAYCLFYKLKNL